MMTKRQHWRGLTDRQDSTSSLSDRKESGTENHAHMKIRRMTRSHVSPFLFLLWRTCVLWMFDAFGYLFECCMCANGIDGRWMGVTPTSCLLLDGENVVGFEGILIAVISVNASNKQLKTLFSIFRKWFVFATRYCAWSITHSFA